jgi:microcystin-dependent protein
MKIVAKSGFNTLTSTQAVLNQLQVTYVNLMAANGSGDVTSNFCGYGACSRDFMLGGCIVAPLQIKVIQVSPAGLGEPTSFRIYGLFGQFIGSGSFYTVDVSPSTSWTHVNTYDANPPAILHAQLVLNVDTAIPPSFVTGMIIAFWGTIAPAGWALCDGGGTPARPDLRGRFIYGWGLSYAPSNTFGFLGGAETHQLLPEEMPSHNHGITFYNDDWNEIGTANNTQTRRDLGGLADDSNGTGSYAKPTSSAGNNFAHNNMPPFIVLAYIIKL